MWKKRGRGINSRSDTREETISEFEDKAIKPIQNEKQREERLDVKMNIIQ